MRDWQNAVLWAAFSEWQNQTTRRGFNGNFEVTPGAFASHLARMEEAHPTSLQGGRLGCAKARISPPSIHEEPVPPVGDGVGSLRAHARMLGRVST
jgi:hypothetical protein